jgi:predicted secreted hydrolase
MKRHAAWLWLTWLALGAHAFEAVTPGKPIAFPRDRGAHPAQRVEWWYVTGHLDSTEGPLGFQVTFFRVANDAAREVPGRFAPREIVLAHAALADRRGGRFLHDQRSARGVAGLVESSTNETGVRLDDWRLVREGERYLARVVANAFAFELAIEPSQPPLLQGDAGFSRKGPLVAQASYYYSEPQLRVTGRVAIGGATREVRGVAWLDHEWSSEYLAREAAGWDWLGANLDDGAALMAFRIRARDGSVLWAAGTWRSGSSEQRFGPDEVEFTPLRHWRSPATGADYPVAMRVRAGSHVFELAPWLDAQELDTRASAGALYWEGAVDVNANGQRAGRGYLELTGYGQPLAF